MTLMPTHPILALLAGLAIGPAGSGGEPGRTEPTAALTEGSHTVALGEVRIHYEVHGSGPVLMTVPNSWGLSLQGLRGMYRPLESRLRIVYFDPRGMGGSSPARDDEDRGMAAVREDFEALRTHLGLGPVDAIGWSNGAMNLVSLAGEHPESLSSAIFVHTVARFTPEDGLTIVRDHPDLVEKVRAFRKAVSEPDLDDAERNARQRRWWLDEYFPLLFADHATAREKLQAAFGSASFSAAHARHANEETPTFDYRDTLHRIPTRSLVIAGTHDLMPADRVKEVADALPHSTYVLFENSGHFSPIEEPEGFREAVFAFLGVSGRSK